VSFYSELCSLVQVVVVINAMLLYLFFTRCRSKLQYLN